MKVIDLLIKIANNEELPKKINFVGKTLILENDKELCYRFDGESSTSCFDWYIENRNLNEEIERIDENDLVKSDKKVEDFVNDDDSDFENYKKIIEEEIR